MANAPAHGLLAELCTLMQRSNDGQREMHKSIEALAECWRMSASASTSRSDPVDETRLQRLYEERTRPAWGASDAYLHLGKQILEQGREQNRVLGKIHEKAHIAESKHFEQGGEETDARRSLQCWARGESALLPRHVQQKLVQNAYEHGTCEAAELTSPFAAKDKRRIELATAVFWKGFQGREPFLFNVFNSGGDNLGGLTRLMPSFRNMMLEAAAQADVQLGEEAASRLPCGKQHTRIGHVLGEFPEGLQALHEVVLPVDRKWRPVLQVRDAEAEAYQWIPYDSLPDSIKRFIDLGQREGLASRRCVRVAATEMVVKWCRHMSELCYMQWALDDAKHREAEAETDEAEEQKRRQVDKRLIQDFLATEYPRYHKISEDYDALQAKRAAEGSETDGANELGAQGGDAPSRASS